MIETVIRLIHCSRSTLASIYRCKTIRFDRPGHKDMSVHSTSHVYCEKGRRSRFYSILPRLNQVSGNAVDQLCLSPLKPTMFSSSLSGFEYFFLLCQIVD